MSLGGWWSLAFSSAPSYALFDAFYDKFQLLYELRGLQGACRLVGTRC
jgi:hypothetical protein